MSVDAARVPSTLGEARADPLQCARSDSSQEVVGVANFSEADRVATEAMEYFWSMSGAFLFIATMSCPENTYRKSSHSQFRQNTLTS